MRRALSIPLVVAALLLAFAAPAFAGESGTTVSLGGLSTGSGSTPAAPPASSVSPGRSGRSGGSGGSHAPSGSATTTTSAPEPASYLDDGAPVCVGGVCTQFLTRNPACATGGSCAAPPSGLACATIHNAAAGAINGRQTCWISYSTPPSTVQVDAHVGYAWGGGIQPTTMGIARWVVNYEGQSYTYPGTWNLVTGNIQAVCDGSPTSGTVEFFLSQPSNPAYAAPPAGWHWQSSPPPAPSLGPYPAGSFSIPACAPDRQQAIQSVTLAPSSNMEAAPTIQNGAQVVANGQTHIFEFVPQVRCPASDPKCGAGLFLQWDGGTAEITNYSPTVLAGVPYPRWESGSASPSWTPGPGHVPNQQVPFGYQGYQPGQTDKLPVFLYTETVGASYNSSGTSYLEEPYVNVGFHAPTYAGDPYQLHISGTYTATWSQYSFYVTAAASWNRVNPTSEVLVSDTPACGGYYYKTVRISKHKTEQIAVCDDWYYPQSTVTWFQPEFQTAQYASAATGIDNTNTEVFPVSATADIGAVQVQIIGGVG
jgi:hypothetical protein